MEDDRGSVYNVEMQVRNHSVLPKRSRYYQDIIDMNILEKGMDFEQLVWKNEGLSWHCCFLPEPVRKVL